MFGTFFSLSLFAITLSVTRFVSYDRINLFVALPGPREDRESEGR